MQTIDMRSLEVKFLEDKDGTGGSLDVFELMLRPKARMPIPHYHESWDETVYGLTGVSTWRVGGQDVEVAPGQCLFIKRGVIHGFTNNTESPTTSLCILTPGVLGRSYFEEIAALLAAGAPDPRTRAGAGRVRADEAARRSQVFARPYVGTALRAPHAPADASGSSVNSSWGCDTPRSA